MIEAANCHPDYLKRQSITAEQLRHVQDACVVFEHEWRDDDGARCFAYTVGGWLDGKPLGGIQGGVTIGGEVAIVHADSREDADAMAAGGLADTLNGLDREESQYIEAHAALARMESVGAMERMRQGTAAPADASDSFTADALAIRKLRGDDIILTTGGVAPPA